MEYTEALAEKIQARITELKSEIAAHERALAALRGRDNARAGNGTASAGNANASDGRRAASRRGNRSGAPRRPRRSRTASAEAVFDALKDGQDQASEIARQFGVSPAVVRNRLQQLEEAGRISRTGNRRSTRWRSQAA
ncbi:MAG TPA: HTH domain-containing protein [Solirubrobacteraceae bacterium]|jgi:predicted Rossmann fold nucleotide-binding protein DprA/Smf involved in DNA uptake|nr:HTH domain-containing protein [Solirubrobacteraceae bacterium]